jgi:hypothetical protein
VLILTNNIFPFIRKLIHKINGPFKLKYLKENGTKTKKLILNLLKIFLIKPIESPYHKFQIKMHVEYFSVKR